MATSKGRGAIGLLVAWFIGGLAAGHAIARWTQADATPSSPAAPAPAVSEATTETAPQRGDTAAAPAAKPPLSPRTTPLPARDLPITSYYDELVLQAADGDAAAARRLADDLYECATRERQLDMAERLLNRGGRGRGPRQPPVDADGERMSPEDFADQRLQAAERFVENAVVAEKRCAGLPDEALSRSADFIRQAALSGDPEAQLCYALAPNEWNRGVLSPQWVDWAERWNTESPGFVRQAFESGLPEAAAVLSNMYTAWQPREGRPWSGRLGEDPYWAYAYAAVAQQTLSSDQATRWSDILRGHATQLNAEQIARADAWAAQARSRIRFQAAASRAPEPSLCANIRRAGSR